MLQELIVQAQVREELDYLRGFRLTAWALAYAVRCPESRKTAARSLALARQSHTMHPYELYETRQVLNTVPQYKY